MKRLLNNAFGSTKLVIGILLSLFSLQSYAQNISNTNLTWNVSHLVDQNTNESVNYACVFKTNGSQSITWLQKGGTVLKTLSVQGLEGTWTDVSQVGQTVYTITSGTQVGTIKFERSAASLLIHFELSQTSGTNLRYQFTVSTVSLTN